MFFFSSRRRHTRFDCDWSSDVCSSDLMVRNSGDHALETPAERRAAGKPETGAITLNAYHEGGHIIIEIADDGRGLPTDRIRAKALANGLATEAELAAMNDAQVQRFIFAAGFS